MEGHYASVQQFIETAIQNQLLIQGLPLGRFEAPEAKQGLTGQSSVLRSLPAGQQASLLVRPRNVLVTSAAISPTRKTIWGLHNRFFPSKIGLRVLANLAEELGKEFVDLETTQEEAGKQARLIGRMLVDYDDKIGSQHGDKLSTGLPVGKQDKSLARFSDMFVGFLKSDESAEGLPADLGFVIIKLETKGNALIGLTEKGKQFVQLANPVLDRQDNSIPDRTLSEDEADFLLSHMRTWLPLEWERCQRVLGAISQGENGPDKLDNVLHLKEKHQSLDNISTERAGIVSRLTELGLVRRKRTGLKVTYSLTERGGQYSNKKREVGVTS